MMVTITNRAAAEIARRSLDLLDGSPEAVGAVNRAVEDGLQAAGFRYAPFDADGLDYRSVRRMAAVIRAHARRIGTGGV